MSGNKETAQDASQEAFARAYARWRRLRDKHWALAWVITTGLNICRKRPKSFVAEHSISRLHAPGPDPDRLHVRTALLELPARQRQAVILHYLCDMSVHEVAEAMGVSDGAVKAHLFKARAKLRQSLDPREVKVEGEKVNDG